MTRLAAFALAEAFLRGHWVREDLIVRANAIVIPPPRGKWLIELTQRVMAAFQRQAPRLAKLVDFLENDWLLIQYLGQRKTELRFDLSRLPRAEMQPSAGAAKTWNVRPLVTTDEVANWLGLTHGELDWFADCGNREAKHPVGPLRHYRYRWIAKTSGGRRLLEVPKPRLKQIQRKILDDILSKIPPHNAAHAYQQRRSIASYVAPHTDKRIVISIDLCEFFPSVRASQVHAIFRTAGYPERVAALLTGLCTNTTPRHVFDDDDKTLAMNLCWKRYDSPHLPQGAPSSPALANLASFWLDCRLSGLAKKVEADYTRYADDFVFSGGDTLARCASRFRVLVSAIAHHEGFEIRRRKTREMFSGTRQEIAGVVLNKRPNIPRKEYDALRATLFNCVKHGPATQNRSNHARFREHLQGRIAYWSTICPERMAKLQSIFEQIVWPSFNRLHP